MQTGGLAHNEKKAAMANLRKKETLKKIILDSHWILEMAGEPNLEGTFPRTVTQMRPQGWSGQKPLLCLPGTNSAAGAGCCRNGIYLHHRTKPWKGCHCGPCLYMWHQWCVHCFSQPFPPGRCHLVLFSSTSIFGKFLLPGLLPMHRCLSPLLSVPGT